MTGEEVIIVSAERHKILEMGIKLAVPGFKTLRGVVDRISTFKTLRVLGVKQPESMVISSLRDLDLVLEEDDGKERKAKIKNLLPGYIKKPLGPSHPVSSLPELKEVCHSWQAFRDNEQVLLQKAIPGPVMLVCGIFHHGKLVAWHATLRVRESVGGASVKVSLPLPVIELLLQRLGVGLGWHGVLSLDAILIEEKGVGEGKELVVVDIKPWITEPMNGVFASVDLVQALLDISMLGESEIWEGEVKRGREGVVSHQCVLALLTAGERGRVALLKEGSGVLSGRGVYKGSTEEIAPLKGWRNVFVLGVLIVLLLVGGRWMVERLSGAGGYG